MKFLALKFHLWLAAVLLATGAAEVAPRLRAKQPVLGPSRASQTLPDALSLLQEQAWDSNQTTASVDALVAQAGDENGDNVLREAEEAIADADQASKSTAKPAPAAVHLALAATGKKVEGSVSWLTLDEDAADDQAPAANTSKAVLPLLNIDEFEQSLIRMGKTAGKVSPGVMNAVTKIKAMITEEMKPRVMEYHGKAQKLLHAYRAAFNKCRRGRSSSVAASESLRKLAIKSSRAHKTCRRFEMKAFKVRDACETLLAGKEETKKATCGSLKDLNRNPTSEADNCHASHSEKFGIWLRRNEAWFKTKRSEWSKQAKKCDAARGEYNKLKPMCKKRSQNHIVMKAMCDVKQDALENAACGFGKKLSQDCGRYTNCWEDAKYDYFQAKPSIQSDERDRKGEWRVLQRALCLLDVFAEKDGEVDASIIDKCKGITHSTTHLNLFYPPVPPLKECKPPPPVPGQNRFKTIFYSGLPFDAKAKPMAHCTVEAGGGLPLGRPRGTTPDKCHVKGIWMKASGGAACVVSDDRQRPVKVDFTANTFTTYKFKMMIKDKRAGFGTFSFCSNKRGLRRELGFRDYGLSRGGWVMAQGNSIWAYHTNKNDKNLGFSRGKPGKANPIGGKEIDVEAVTRWTGSALEIWSWSVNGVHLSGYGRGKIREVCKGASESEMAPVLYARGASKEVYIGDFRVFQGPNPIVGMPQIIGDGVPRTYYSVRCGERNIHAYGRLVGGSRVKKQMNELNCQQYCASFSGCSTFVYAKDRSCRIFAQATRYVRKHGSVTGPPVCELPYTTGLKVEFYWFPRQIKSMPSLMFRKPDQTRTDLVVNYANTGTYWPGIEKKDKFVAKWKGSLFIKNSGFYTFAIASDDGSFLWIDGNKLLSNGGLHGLRWKTLRTHLKSGWHSVNMMYFENTGHAGMFFKYSGPDSMWHFYDVPTEVLRPEFKASKKKSRQGMFGIPNDRQYYRVPAQSNLLTEGTKTYVLFSLRSKGDAHVTLYDKVLDKPPAPPKRTKEDKQTDTNPGYIKRRSLDYYADEEYEKAEAKRLEAEQAEEDKKANSASSSFVPPPPPPPPPFALLSRRARIQPSRLPKGSYEIVLGGWDNQRSAIRKGTSTKEEAFPYTKNILSKDEYRKFWISVDKETGAVSVGRGHDINRYAFMTWEDPEVFVPKGFAVMAGDMGPAEFVFHNKKYGSSNRVKQRLGKTAWLLGKLGEDCTTTCADEGRVCDSNIRAGYSYNKFRAFVHNAIGTSCEKDNRAWFSKDNNDQPCYVMDGPDANQGKCLASRNIPHEVRCSGKHPKVMRWCKCSASEFKLTYKRVGRKTWTDMEKEAEKEGGRLMTLDEVRLVLKQRNAMQRAIVPDRDAWAAVTNPASTCKVKIGEKEYLMDWVQIGNRGHITGKSHFEHHGCPGWGNAEKRPHADSGYLMLAKLRAPAAKKL